MKILLINNIHYRKGGSEAVYFNQAELLRKEGHEVIFFSISRPENLPSAQAGYFATCQQTEGASRLAVLKDLRNYFYNPEAARRLEELVVREKPDLAHVHLFWGGLSPSIFSVLRKHHIPLVHTVHDYRMVCPAYTFRDGGGRVCEACGGKHFYRCAVHRCAKGSLVKSLLMAAEMYTRNLFFHPAGHIDGLVFVSRFSQEKHIRNAPAFRHVPARVLYNAVPSLGTYPEGERESYLLCYGRLSPEKGISTLLKAARALPRVRFKLVGTGPLQAQIQTYKQTEQLDNVEILGYRSGEPLYRLIAGAAYVIVPSECYENNPMTIVEAYALSTPVIGSRIGGIPEIIREGETGYTFAPADADDLADTIRRALALDVDGYHALRRAARRFAEAHFNEKTYYRELMAFYEELIAGAAGKPRTRIPAPLEPPGPRAGKRRS